MADQQGGAPPEELGELPVELGLGHGVEGRGRLVEDEQLRVAGEGAGDGDPLPLPPGEALAAVEDVPDRGVVAVGKAPGELCGPGASRGIGDRGRVGLQPPGPQIRGGPFFLRGQRRDADGLPEGELEPVEVLEGGADGSCQAVRVDPGVVGPVGQYPSARGRVETEEDLGQGRLAGSVLAHEGDALPRGQVETDPLQHRGSAAGTRLV